MPTQTFPSTTVTLPTTDFDQNDTTSSPSMSDFTSEQSDTSTTPDVSTTSSLIPTMTELPATSEPTQGNT